MNLNGTSPSLCQVFDGIMEEVEFEQKNSKLFQTNEQIEEAIYNH